MADEEHSTLTGSALHEPKGAAAAAANRVYVSDGVGSGSWGQVTNSVLDSSAKVFQGTLVHFRNQQLTTVAGGATTTGSFVTATVNTEVSDDGSFGSVASNQITLPAGTYFLIGWVNWFTNMFNGESPKAQVRLRNITAGSTTLTGRSIYVDISGGAFSVGISQALPIMGRFTIAVPTVFEFQIYTNDGHAQGQGLAASSGEVEVYSDYLFWKTA